MADVIAAHFSSFDAFLSYLSQEKLEKEKEQQKKRHTTANMALRYFTRALPGAAPSTSQVPARDYSITFQQEPRSFETRKNKQHKRCQMGSPGTPNRIFCGVISGDNLESASHSPRCKL